MENEKTKLIVEKAIPQDSKEYGAASINTVEDNDTALSAGTEDDIKQNAFTRNVEVVTDEINDRETPSTLNHEEVSATSLLTSTNPPVSSKLTLLEKAEIFRERNPNLWQERFLETERKEQEMQEIDEFLESYYKRFDEIEAEKKERKIKELTQPPCLMLELIFNLPRKENEAPLPGEETYKSLSCNLTVFHRQESFKELLIEDKNEERGLVPEMYVRVKKARSLHNFLKKIQYKKVSASIKCSLYNEKQKRIEKESTEYVHILPDGRASWNHVFVLKDYSQDILKNYKMKFQLQTKHKENHDSIEEFTLCCGKTGQDTLGNNPWKDALKNPGKLIKSSLTTKGDKIPKNSSNSSNSEEKKEENSSEEQKQNETTSLSPKHKKTSLFEKLSLKNI